MVKALVYGVHFFGMYWRVETWFCGVEDEEKGLVKSR